jgi:hypothetical protein
MVILTAAALLDCVGMLVRVMAGSRHSQYNTTHTLLFRHSYTIILCVCRILVRRLVIAAVANTVEPSNLTKKFTWLTFCNVIFILIHIVKRPYVLHRDNEVRCRFGWFSFFARFGVLTRCFGGVGCFFLSCCGVFL